MVKTSSSHRWSPGSNPWRSHICSVLLQRNLRVETMRSGITKLYDGDVSWLLQNWEDWGCGSSGTCVCWRTAEDGWWISSTACVKICWRWVHWQRGVGCLGSHGSYPMSRKPPWDGNRMGWDGGRFYQECLASPPGGWIRLNVGAWRGRENCLVWWLEREICPSLVPDGAGTNTASLEFATQR